MYSIPFVGLLLTNGPPLPYGYGALLSGLGEILLLMLICWSGSAISFGPSLLHLCPASFMTDSLPSRSQRQLITKRGTDNLVSPKDDSFCCLCGSQYGLSMSNILIAC